MSYSDQGKGEQAPLKVYWQPGCSSCLKTKEFLIENGMEFVSITNYMTNDYSYDEDGDALAIPILTFQTFVDYSQFSQGSQLQERLRFSIFEVESGDA